MTFSIIARDTSTGRIGMASTTSDLAVGARVLWGRAGVGGVITQHTTDPRLGIRGLDLLAAGCDAEQTADALMVSATCPEARQLAVVDARGRTAVRDGAYVDTRRAYSTAADGFAVVGNVLASPAVGAAIADAYRAESGLDLAQRLIAALRAGEAAGGEGVPLVSAAVKIYDAEQFPYADLRIDRADDPLGALTSLEAEYAPRRDDFVRRALDPDVSYAAEYAQNDTYSTTQNEGQ